MTTEIYEEICKYLRRAIEDTQWRGNVYTVGGCCRDSIMNLPIKDVDLAVSTPDGGIKFAEWLYNKGLTVGEPVTFPKYGTARLRLREFPDDELELVQTRKEKYTDRTSRDPSTAFGSIEDDCYRRDLTINSLYYDISNDRMLDITGRGIADMDAHIIRTPADPDMTFDDDPVRIVRAVRFAAKFGWEIDPAAYEAMQRHVSRLSIITPERMQGEFEKVLISPRPAMALELLRSLGAMEYIMPELCKTYNLKQTHFHFGTVWEHTLAVVEKVPAEPLLRYAALLHDIGKIVSVSRGKDGRNHFPRHDRRSAALVDKIMHRLHFRKPFIDKVVFLCVNHEAAKGWGRDGSDMKDADLRELQHLCHTPRRFENLMTLIDADNRSYAPEHCMPDQVAVILRRDAELRANGSAMYGYTIPIKRARVCKILNIRPDKNDDLLLQIARKLYRAAFENPTITREQLAALVATFSTDGAIEAKSKVRKQHRKSRWRRKSSK